MGIDEKVRRLDTSTHAIFTLLTDIAATQRRHADRMYRIEEILSEISTCELQQRLGGERILDRVTGIDAKLAAMTDTQLQQDERFTEFDRTLGDVDDTVRSLLDELR